MRISMVLIVLALTGGAVSAETTVTINGKTITADGNRVIVGGNTVVVDGKMVSGNVVEGSGENAIEIRGLDPFNEIHLYLDADVTVTPGETAPCTITADGNILPLISTDVSGSSLRISTRESYVSRRKVTIDLQTPHLIRAEVTGSGNMNLRDVGGERLTLAINGSGDIAAEGHVEQLTVMINGSGNVQAADLEAATVNVTVNGSGDADIYAARALTAKILGSGDVRYIGTPNVQTSVLGSGELVKK
jgi:hypothetical protein